SIRETEPAAVAFGMNLSRTSRTFPGGDPSILMDTMDRTQLTTTARQTSVALRETLVLALDTLRAHKLRSFLTLLGVILAVATLVSVMSVLNGLNVYVADKVANLGANAFIIDRTGIITNFEQWTKSRKRPPIDIGDLEALREKMTLAT